VELRIIIFPEERGIVLKNPSLSPLALHVGLESLPLPQNLGRGRIN
jgi:hypothetical protein